jgi:hypothetical protein
MHLDWSRSVDRHPQDTEAFAARIPRIHAYCDSLRCASEQIQLKTNPLIGIEIFTLRRRLLRPPDGGHTILASPRGYATVTGNGGHESVMGFDGVWAANAPELQEDFGWRSNHVVTLISKFIVTRYYGTPMKHSYMVGNSKGGQAVLMEAQRFPEDFDGLMPSAPVYDYTGRNTIAAAWFAQGITDGHGSSVITAETSRVVHNSVLEHCGAQSGVEEGLVTDPPSCQWKPGSLRPGTRVRTVRIRRGQRDQPSHVPYKARGGAWAPLHPGTGDPVGPGITLGR